MNRKELLDRLRRELPNRDWRACRPDERLGELDDAVMSLCERIEQIQDVYFSNSEEDVLAALDDLAAALSYLRVDIGGLFSDVTRLADELRSEVDRLDAGDEAGETTVELPGLRAAARESTLEASQRTPETNARPERDGSPADSNASSREGQLELFY